MQKLGWFTPEGPKLAATTVSLEIGGTMSKYLVTASYNAEGAKGLMEEGGSKRLAAATAAIESGGGSIDSFYYAFGEHDVIGIVDFPDAASAVAVSLMINSTGAVSLTLKPLITVEEIDAAAAMTPSYRGPGS
jgi:uncharacterized protein with GYD domain